jgi:hypothetical protein
MPPVTKSVAESLMPLPGSVAVMFVAPLERQVARPSLPPALLAVATAGLEELQVTESVRSWVVASLYVPTALNCSEVPTEADGLWGVTASETRTAAVTSNVVEPAMALAGSVADIALVPIETLVAKPSLPEALLTVATAGIEELHVTEPVRSWVVASLYVPVAVNCCVVPSAIEEAAGVTAIETRTAAVTPSVVEPATALAGSVADIVLVPIETLKARPSLPKALLTVATAGLEELHVTAPVRSWVVASLYVPVAANAWVVPSAIEGAVGVTSIESKAAAVTPNVVEPAMALAGSVAVSVLVPIETLAARPSLPEALLTVATAGIEELHRFCTVLSVKVPIAVSCMLVPSAICGRAGVRETEDRSAGVTVSSLEPLIPLSGSVAAIVVVPATRPVAMPWSTVATDVLVELQVREAVRSFSVPFQYFPIAVNGCWFPAVTEGWAGVTAMDLNDAVVPW